MARSSSRSAGGSGQVSDSGSDQVDTPLGPARLHRYAPAGRPLGTLVLGHGAGGGVEAGDLVAVTAAAVAAGWRAVLVEQPWRVAGRRVAPAPPRLDVGWRAALAALAESGTGTSGAPLVVGGRSAGARVACRTAEVTGAAGVVCLSFPLHPPGRPERSRAAELAGVDVPVLVVQGARDPFGRPDELADLGLPGVTLVEVPGDHGLSGAASTSAAARAVQDWLARLLAAAGSAP